MSGKIFENNPVSRAFLGLAVLALGGLLLLPLARHARHLEEQANLRMPPVPVSLIRGGDALGEQLSLFLLGGLNSLASEILILDATTAWIQRDWPRAERRWQMATTLNPRRPNYWINAARDMSVNAAAHSLHNKDLSPIDRVRLSRAYFDRGVRFLRQGIAHHPRSALLRISLGDTFADLNRFPDFAAAAAAYRDAVRLGASPLYARQEFYNLCRIRGREQEAWQLGRSLFDSPAQRVPSLLCLLFVLQQKIDVPPAQQLSPSQLFGSDARARRELARFRRNSLRFPTSGIPRFLSEQPHEPASGKNAPPPGCGDADNPKSSTPNAPSRRAALSPPVIFFASFVFFSCFALPGMINSG